MPTTEQITQQDQADAAFVAKIANDYDPEGHRSYCEDHDNVFFTYCVICPDGESNGKYVPAPVEVGEDLPF